MKNSEVKDNVAIATRAVGGLGFGVAARLAEEQAVLLTDINAKLLGEAAAKLAANGATVAHVACDVSDRASVQAAFAAARGSTRRGLRPRQRRGKRPFPV